MAKIRLKNGRIFDGEHFLRGEVLIEDEKIFAIGEDAAEEAADALVIDCAGGTVCPGLVDIHTHLLEISGKPFGFPALLATVPFGVTAAVDASANLPADASAALPIDTAVLTSLALENGEIDFRKMESRLAAYGDRALGVKIYFDVGQGVLPTVSQLREVSVFTRERGLLTMVHCTGSPAPMKEIVEALSEGDILTHAYHGAPHTVAEDNSAAYRLARERGVIIDAGMAGGVHTDFEVLRKALAQGYAPDVISTDITQYSAYMRGGIYGLPMCMSIYRALGMPEKEVLRAVTSRAASAVKREGVWGSLSIGARADLCVLSYGNLAIDITDRAKNRLVLSDGYTCKMTVKDGRILYRNGI